MRSIEYRGSEAEKKFTTKTYEQDMPHFFRERLEFYLRELRASPTT